MDGTQASRVRRCSRQHERGQPNRGAVRRAGATAQSLLSQLIVRGLLRGRYRPRQTAMAFSMGTITSTYLRCFAEMASLHCLKGLPYPFPALEVMIVSLEKSNECAFVHKQFFDFSDEFFDFGRYHQLALACDSVFFLVCVKSVVTLQCETPAHHPSPQSHGHRLQGEHIPH